MEEKHTNSCIFTVVLNSFCVIKNILKCIITTHEGVHVFAQMHSVFVFFHEKAPILPRHPLEFKKREILFMSLWMNLCVAFGMTREFITLHL